MSFARVSSLPLPSLSEFRYEKTLGKGTYG